MHKTFSVALFCASTVLILTSGTDDVLSSGAPIGSTGAPGEQTCGKAGCHTGDNGANNINSGAATIGIHSVQDLSNYTPGNVYDISVSIQAENFERFGFSLTVLDEKNNRAGDLIITDEQRTQIIEGVLNFSGREYVTYRMPGTNPYEQGKGLWQFKWKAPDNAVGKVTFYAAAVAADNDGTDKGDWVYTTSVSSELSPSAINYFNTPRVSCNIFPNPVTDVMNVHVLGGENDRLSFSVYDVNGRRIDVGAPEASEGNSYAFSLKNLGLSKGIYGLKLESKHQSVQKKFLFVE